MRKLVVLPYIRCFVIVSIAFLGCKARKDSGLKQIVSNSNVEGYVQAGKGFELRDRRAMENVCVTGDNGSLNDAFGQPSNQDPNAHPTPSDPSIPPPITTDPNNPNPGFPTGNPTNPTTPGFPTPTNPGNPTVNPGTPNPGVPVDPYVGSPFFNANVDDRGNPTAGRFGKNQRNYAGNVIIAGPTSGSLGASGEQGGSSKVTLSYYSSTRDVRNAINASVSDTGSGSFTKDDIKGDFSGSFNDVFQQSTQNTTEYVYFFMHGRKTFGRINSDVITNPIFNTKLNNLIFGATDPADSSKVVVKLPTEPDAIKKSYDTFRKMCGDTYVESVIRGREVWGVAKMDRSTYNKIISNQADIGLNGGLSAPSVGDLKNEFKAGLGVKNTNSLLKMKVDVSFITRGKSDSTVRSMALEDALTNFNTFMISGSSDGEGVIDIDVRRYNNVRINIEGQEKRIGDAFPREILVKLAESDSFYALKLNKQGASFDSQRLWEKYGMDQWSLSEKYYDGIARQYNLLKTYVKTIEDFEKKCPDGFTEQSSATAECIAEAKRLATISPPKTKEPAVREKKLTIYVPQETIQDQDPKNWTNSWTKLQFTQPESEKKCTDLGDGFRLPNAQDWENIVQTSYFYTQWRKAQDSYLDVNNKVVTNYDAKRDSNPLSMICGRFSGAYFWSAEAGQVTQVDESCSTNAVSFQDVPAQYRFTSYIFWTKPKSHYICVKYTNEDNKPVTGP